MNWLKKKWNVVKNGWKPGWPYILLCLVGSYLPCWFPCVTSWIEGKEACWESLLNVANINVMAISLLSMTLYLWNKDRKFNKEDSRKDGDVLFLIFIVVAFLLYGYLICSKLSDNNEICSRFNIFSYVLFMFVFCVYIYYQLKDFAENNKVEESKKESFPKSVNKDVYDLNNDVNKRFEDMDKTKDSNSFDDLNNDISKRL